MTTTLKGTVALWDMRTGRLLRTLAEHGDSARGALSGDASTAVSQGATPVLHVWDTATGGELGQVPLSSNIFTAAFAPDDRTVAVGCENGMVHLVSVRPVRELRRFRAQTSPVKSVGMSADGKLLLSSSEEGSFRLWDVESGRCVHAFDRAPAAGPRTVAFAGGVAALPSAISADGRRMVLCRSGNGATEQEVIVWDVRRLVTHREFQTQLPAARAALAANPRDPAALRCLGEYFAFRDVDEWAVELLERAASPGRMFHRFSWPAVTGSSTGEDAAREFRSAIERNEAPTGVSLHSVSRRSRLPRRLR